MPKTCGKSIDDEKIWKYFRAPSRVLQKVQDQILHDAYMLLKHGLRTPNDGINQRYLKNWADVADKICFGRT